MVRDPISRILSHWRHATGAGYETRPMEDVLTRDDQTYVTRSMYWMQLQPYLELFPREQIEVIAQEELQQDREATMRRAFEFAGVDADFTSEQFDREWEKSTAKESRPVPADGEADQAPGLPLLRPQLRPPARAHALDGREGRPRPRRPRGAEAELTPADRVHLTRLFGEDSKRIQEFAGREFPRWKSYG